MITEKKEVIPKTVFLHIGMSKTGTTAIQRFLFENRGVLEKNGIIYPDNYRDPDMGYKDWAHHILSHKWGGWLDPKVFPFSPDMAWRKLAETINTSSGTFIISSERFQDLLIQPNYKEILEYIKEKVSPAKLKIIGYVRRQDTFAESHYKELVKNSFNRTSFTDYVDDLPKFYDYHYYFERCAEIVGRKNVVVRIFDKKYFKNGNLFDDFAYACGFDLPDNALPSEKQTNPSLGSSSARIMSEHSVRSFWRDQVFRSEMFSFFNHKKIFDEESKPLLSSIKRNEVMSRFSESNSALIRDYLNPNLADAFDEVEVKQEDAFNDETPIFTAKDIIKILSAAAKSHERSIKRIEKKSISS